jgi:hypothetical protein
MLTRFKGNILYEPGKPGLVTNEGPVAVKEAITYIEGLTDTRSALTWNDAMFLAVREHC